MTGAELPVVADPDNMDNETFLKHFNARHVPMAGLTRVIPSGIPGDEDEHLLRLYHDHVHRDGIEDRPPDRRPVNHDHLDES